MSAIVCPRCQANSYFEVVWQNDGRSRLGRFYDAAFRCQNPHCGVVIGGGITLDSERAICAYWPAKLHEKTYLDVPEQIATAASEAHRCQSVSAHRGAVLLARAVIEATAKDKKIISGSLAMKIDELCKQQFIRPHIRDEAHEIRHLGNDMAHGDFVEPVTADDADAVLLLMGEVLNEVFQGPAVAARLRARRTASG